MVTTPRERRHLRTRQTILDAARRIIGEAGPDALSMRALAERIDYSPAGLYEYFAGKDEIIAAVCEEGHARLAAYMRQADPKLPTERYLFEIGMAYIRFALENPDYFLLMFTTAPELVEETEQETPEDASSYAILVKAIERGLEDGTFSTRPDFGLEAMAYAAWVTVHGIAMLRTTALRTHPADFEAADRQALRNFMRGLQAR